MPEITHLLAAAAHGDRQAAADLLPLVYEELRKLAAARMAAERPGHTLDPTALVHEAYLRLIGDQHFDGKAHFFGAAAEAMRRVLVNHARDRARLNRIRYHWGRQLKMTPDTSGMPPTASGRERPPHSDACKQAPRSWVS